MKTNKIKPIKKIMIFTIITVMIASLFAVPAFAFTMHAPNSTFTLPSSLSQETDLIGGYAVRFKFSTLVSELSSYVDGDSTASVTIFNTRSGFSCFVATGPIGLDLDLLTYEECTRIEYSAGTDSVRFYNNSSTAFQTISTDESALETILLMDTETKKEWESAIGGFMNTATYSVASIVSASTPDPEVPENPTVSGVWVFNYDLKLIEVSQVVNFSSGPNAYTEITLREATFGDVIPQMEYDDNVIYQGTWMQDWAQVVDFGETPQVVSPDFYNMLLANAVQQTPEEPDDPIPPADGEEQGIFAVWSKITQWIVQGLTSVSNAFYANGKLTLLGTLCIIPLALGLALLLISIVQKFLHLRG